MTPVAGTVAVKAFLRADWQNPEVPETGYRHLWALPHGKLQVPKEVCNRRIVTAVSQRKIRHNPNGPPLQDSMNHSQAAQGRMTQSIKASASVNADRCTDKLLHNQTVHRELRKLNNHVQGLVCETGQEEQSQLWQWLPLAGGVQKDLRRFAFWSH